MSARCRRCLPRFGVTRSCRRLPRFGPAQLDGLLGDHRANDDPDLGGHAVARCAVMPTTLSRHALSRPMVRA